MNRAQEQRSFERLAAQRDASVEPATPMTRRRWLTQSASVAAVALTGTGLSTHEERD